MANDETTNTEEVVQEKVADVAVETSEEIQNETAVEEKPKKTKKSSKKKAEVVPEVLSEEDKEKEIEADEDAASEASKDLNIMDDAKTAEVPEESENVKAHFYKFRKEGFQLGLDPNGFVSTVLMKKFRFGFIMNNNTVDFVTVQNKCISYVKAALNKLNDPDTMVREIKTPSYVEPEKFYNVFSVHVPFHAKINEVEKEMKNTIALLNNTITDDSVKFLVRIGNYADLIVDSTKQSEGDYVCFKGFQSLTYSKPKNNERPARETISAGLYANETMSFKQKDISYVNKANLNVCKMNLFGKNVKFDPISHHDINFGKRFACIIWQLLKEENNFKLVRYICDISLRDYKAFGKISVTDGVKTIIKKEEIDYGMATPKFESIFQGNMEGEPNAEILCTMLNAPREDQKWIQFDNDVDIIDQCMFSDLHIEEEEV